MFDEDPFATLIIDDMPVQLEYTVPVCGHGDRGTKWKTAALSEDNALKLLERHVADAHGQRDGEAAAGGGAGGRSRLAKIPTPSVSGGCSKEEFNIFTSKWERYVRSFPEVDTTKLRDQLFSCPDKNLRTALHWSHGAWLSTISVADWLKEIKKLALVRQSNNVNMLALMK